MPKNQTLEIKSATTGMPFTVRLVRKGDTYGLKFLLTHTKDEPMVEFYDRRFSHTKYGQFVSRYNLSTITTHPPGSGLSLDDGIPLWSVDAAAMDEVKEWLSEPAPDGKDETETPVIFRKFGKSEGESIIAIFPAEPDTLSGYGMTSYMHVGQHGGANPELVNRTRLATPEEYADLKAELENHFGYRLKVCQRISKHHRAAREAERDRMNKIDRELKSKGI